ncbi:MAG: hypothetical protein FWE09_05045 [Treponema sp.]|nr:hypothetical protein [Treponema sp.]
MIITRTVEITDSRRLRLEVEVPRDVPPGKALLELKVIPIDASEEKPAPRLRLTQKELGEMLEKSPITRELTGILSGAKGAKKEPSARI